MPTYEYVCLQCGEHVEVYQAFSDEPLSVCPNCGGQLRKVFHPAGILFRGSGFYKTDSRSKSSSGDSKSGASSSKSSDSKAESGSSDAKPSKSSDSSGSSGSSGTSGSSEGSSKKEASPSGSKGSG